MLIKGYALPFTYLQAKMDLMQRVSTMSWVEVQFLLKAVDVLSECRCAFLSRIRLQLPSRWHSRLINSFETVAYLYLDMSHTLIRIGKV